MTEFCFCFAIQYFFKKSPIRQIQVFSVNDTIMYELFLNSKDIGIRFNQFPIWCLLINKIKEQNKTKQKAKYSYFFNLKKLDWTLIICVQVEI